MKAWPRFALAFTNRDHEKCGNDVTGTLVVKINGEWVVEPAAGAKALSLK